MGACIGESIFLYFSYTVKNNYLSLELLHYILREKGIVGKTVFDRAVCEDASFNDIDKEKVKWFLRMAKDKRNYPLSEKTPVKGIFAHLNLLHKGALTNAAVLLFGKNPQKFHLQAEIKCLQFHGTEVKKPFASYHNLSIDKTFLYMIQKK